MSLRGNLTIDLLTFFLIFVIRRLVVEVLNSYVCISLLLFFRSVTRDCLAIAPQPPRAHHRKNYDKSPLLPLAATRRRVNLPR